MKIKHRYAELEKQVLVLMKGDSALATAWMHEPQEIFGNKTPYEHAQNEQGALEVEKLIGRIIHGVFS